MSVKDRIYIKTDSNGYYSKSGTYKSLRQLYTRNNVTWPKKNLCFLSNPVTSSILPNGIQPLEYIDATGQYIITPWYPDQTFGIEIRWSTTNTSNSVAQVFGGGGDAYNDRAFECYPWDGLLQLNFGSSSLNTLSVVANNIYTIRMMQRNVYVKNETSGAEYSSTHSSVTFRAAMQLCLFDINRTGGHSLASYGRIYSCKIYKNSRVISELIPCQLKGTGSKGLYDKITGWFYGFNGNNIDFSSGYYNIPSTSNTKMANSDYWIFPGSETDRMLDARVPILSDRLYKSNQRYDLAHPRLLAIMDSFYTSGSSGSWTELLRGTSSTLTASWSLNEFGSSDGKIPPAGILVCQGGGGGSGGAEPSGDDTAGGGGGGGGNCIIYYRVKKGTVNLWIQAGCYGSAGPSGVGQAGSGGGSKIKLTQPDGNYVQINADGGVGGYCQNASYSSGGSGGSTSANYYSNGGATHSIQYWGQGGGAGTSSGVYGGGGSASTSVGLLCDTEYLYAYAYYVVGGGGGGAGDDTGGSGVAAGYGGSVPGTTLYFPKYGNCSSNQTVSLSTQSGGAYGWENNDATPGGGGASLWHSGGRGGAQSSNLTGAYTGMWGTDGSGAGGSCVANNAARGGATGGSGFVALWKY